MKKILSALFAIFILAAVFLAATTAQAGGSYGGVTVTTTTNFLVFTGTTNAYNGLTNTISLTPSAEYIVLTNVVNTNEVFIGSVYVQVPQSALTNFSGFTNLFLIGSITNSFAAGLPAGGIWSTTTTPVAGSLNFPWILQANNGIYTNGIYAAP